MVSFYTPSGSARTKLQPETMAVSLEERGGSVTITVHGTLAQSVTVGDCAKISNGPGSDAVWRVKTIDSDIVTDTATITLEHMINSLKDWLIPTEIGPADMGGSSTSVSAHTAASYVISYQSTWQLGAFEFSGSAPFEFNGDSLFEALETICGTLEGAEWGYDFSTTPYTLNIGPHATVPAAEMRLDRNISTMKTSISTAGMYTRFYPIGKNDLRITGRYISKNESLYGVISKTETDQSLDTEAKLIAWANERLSKHAEPTVTITISGLELSESTGEPLDALRINKLCRCPLPSLGTTITERITKLQWPNVVAEPERVNVTLANTPEDLASIIRSDKASSSKGGRATAKDSGEKHAWLIDENDHVGLLAEAVAGEGADQDWSRVASVMVDGEGVHQRVTRTEGEIVTAQASIEILEDEIDLEVTNRTNADNTLSGRITVEAGKITQIVSAVGDDGEVTAASICLAINNSTGESEAWIDAQKVWIGDQRSTTYIAGQLSADRARITTLETDYLQTANLKAEIGDITGLKVLGITTDNTSGFASFPDIIASRSLMVDGVNCYSLPDGVKEVQLINVTGTTTYKLQYRTYRNTVTWQDAGSFSLAAAQSYLGTWSGDNTGDTATYTVIASPGDVQIAQSSLVLHINSQAAYVTDPNGTIRARVDNTQYEAGWIAAANAVVAPAAATGEVLAFSVTVPANTGSGDTTTVDFGITKGTPSASGGFAAVTYGNRVVGRISLDDWWDGGFDAVSLSQAWATGDTGASNQLTVSADAKTDGTVRRRTFSLGLEAAGWSSGSNNVQLRSNGSVVAHLSVSIPANSTAGWANAYVDGDYYVSGNLGGRVLSYTFSGSEAYRAGWAAAEGGFDAPTTTPASLGGSVTITGPNSTVDGTPVPITYTLSADSSYVYLKYGANVVARTANPGGGAMAIGTPTWANAPGSTGTSVTWGTSNTVTVPTADGNDSISIGLYMTQGSTWTNEWIRNTYIRLDSASGRYVAKMPVDASGVYTSGHNAGRDAVTIAGLTWSTGTNSSSTRRMTTSTSGRYTEESTYQYELVLKNGSDNDTVILTVDNVDTAAAAAQRMAFTHGQYTSGWRAAYGVWRVPAAGTAATCTFTFPAYANNTTTTRTYTLSETNTYCYLKDPNGNTVARITNGAYDAGYTSGYDIGYAAGKLAGWQAFWDDKPDWIEAWDEGGGTYSVWTPKREPPDGWIGDGSSATCVKWFEYSTTGSHSPSASGLARQSVQAGDSFISGCRHLSTPWTEPSTGGMYYKFTVTCGGSSAQYYFKV